ncbi:hypothetical protein GCM10011391_32190 [Pullulanibacillus camelliae]|uniref:DNA ligase (ATP) n=2 Tax=Pullulanibacillus camelliae TaxID=1707096 RepID=A0A8J2YLK7_9BACL|nr:hypothetical protein GCM10011391_32190 [Pullulanibacillus camelliae]
MIALGADGKPSFHEVMRRDGLRRLERVKYVKKDVPISYMVFDILFYNGQWITDWRLQERLDLLNKILVPNDHIHLVSSHPSREIHSVFEVVQQHGMEGIVMKDLKSPYFINEKNDRWQKKKNYKDLIGVVGGITLRDNVVNALLLGLYDSEGNLWYIGHAGTGKLKQSEWRHFTRTILPFIIETRPFINQPDRHEEAIWVSPVITVKIQYIEWKEGRSVRQPSIQAFVDVPPNECLLPERI